MPASATPLQRPGADLPYAAPALLALGLLTLALPTGWRMAHTLWATDAYGHGPLIVGLCAWLAWRRRLAWAALPDTPVPLSGGVLFGVGLLAYAVGRSQGIDGLEVFSLVVVLAALALCLKGAAGLRLMGLPLLFLLFAVPLPGILVQTLTMPLKTAVSAGAEWLMREAGYPVGRMGVVLSMGPYRLLVADACAGLNSVFTLEALGLLWMSLRPRRSAWRNALLALLILPISFMSNVVRVMVLMLVTYHFGDAAGQGFMHGFSGLLLFVVAVLLMVAADVLIGRAPRRGVP